MAILSRKHVQNAIPKTPMVEQPNYKKKKVILC